jgi:hypothetical protein
VLSIAFALIFFGAGPISVDSIFSGRPNIRSDR